MTRTRTGISGGGVDDSASEGSAFGVVAIVGRPNVGKSTLFNRIIGRRMAIVDEMSGLTRDRLYGIGEWRARRFTVIDTAGIDRFAPELRTASEEIHRGTQVQARQAIAEADVCVLVLDIRAGLTVLDEEVAEILRHGRKPLVVVGNKAESPKDPHLAHELHRLGMGDPIFISALQGTNVGDLLDAVVEKLPPPAESEEPATDELRLAIIGRPNVGKSSLLNALAGAPRSLVSAVAGTTRDAVDTVLQSEQGPVRLVDTAGIRRRGVISTDVEHYSLLRALKAMERCDVAVLVIDAADGVVIQDRHVAGYAIDAGKGLCVVANKWDLVDAEQRASPAFLKRLQQGFAFVPGVPLLTASALEGRNVTKVIDMARKVAEARALRVPTAPLNALIQDAVFAHPPKVHKGRQLKLFYATQAPQAAPTFYLFVNDPKLFHASYGRYLENCIRRRWGFGGVRLRMVPKARREEER